MNKMNSAKNVSYSLLVLVGALFFVNFGFADPGSPAQGPDKPAIPPNPTQLFCMTDCRDLQVAIGQSVAACLYVPARNEVRDLNGNVWDCIYGPNIPDPYQTNGSDGSSQECQDPYQSGC